MKQDAASLFQARKKRIDDAIALRVPDRVPVWFGDFGYFPAKYSGFTCEEAMFEPEKQFAAYHKTLNDFAPDIFFGPGQSVRAKEFLGGTMCIAGMMPLSVLQFGTPEEIKTRAKQLIDNVGKDGGYIMGPKSIMDEAKPELVQVWMQFTKEYGRSS
jgi:hypothetical protein